jgi:hypothetical protein
MPKENQSAEPAFDLKTSAGGRGYIAHLFKTRLKRHDYTRYIGERLAADFACTLSAWLAPLLREFDHLKSHEGTPHYRLNVELYAVTLERDVLIVQVAEREALLEQVLTNAERGLPPDLHRALRELIPAPSATNPANEAEREPFEAWHRRRFATKHMSGEPTRDMHNGVRDPNYGPPNQQQMWEAWQARAALKPVEDVSDDA